MPGTSASKSRSKSKGTSESQARSQTLSTLSPSSSTDYGSPIPTSPTVSANRPERSSHPFEYSTGRPVTGFSEAKSESESAWSDSQAQAQTPIHPQRHHESSSHSSHFEPLSHTRIHDAAHPKAQTSAASTHPSSSKDAQNPPTSPASRRGGRRESTLLRRGHQPGKDGGSDNPFDVTDSIVNTEGEYEYTGPLYQRSDWGAPTTSTFTTSSSAGHTHTPFTAASGSAFSSDALDTAPATAWSRSSYAAQTPRTNQYSTPVSLPGEGGVPPLPSPYGGKADRDGVDVNGLRNGHGHERGRTADIASASTLVTSTSTASPRTTRGVGAGAGTGAGPNSVEYVYDQGMIMDSPGQITPGVRRVGNGIATATATPRTARTPFTPLSSGPALGFGPEADSGVPESSHRAHFAHQPRGMAGAIQVAVRGEERQEGERKTRDSTLPSILDLDHLTPHAIPNVIPQANTNAHSRSHLHPDYHGHQIAGAGIGARAGAAAEAVCSRSPSPSPSPARFTGRIRAPSPSGSVSPTPSSGLLLPPSLNPGTILRPDRDPFSDPSPSPLSFPSRDPEVAAIAQSSEHHQGARHRSVYAPVTTPDFTRSQSEFQSSPQSQNGYVAPAPGQPQLLTPQERNTLGKMSVAAPVSQVSRYFSTVSANADSTGHRNNDDEVYCDDEGRVDFSKPPSRPHATHQHTLLSPTKQNKLGRMSVAPPRYTLPPQRGNRAEHMSSLSHGEARDSLYPSEQAGFERSPRHAPDLKHGHVSHPSNDRDDRPYGARRIDPAVRDAQKATRFKAERPTVGHVKRDSSSASASPSILSKLKRTPLTREYLTWRPFIGPLLTLACALVLTVSHGISDSPLGAFVRLGEDTFKVSRAGGVPVNLGVWGWCQTGVNDPQCQQYTFRDFGNEDATFTIPGQPTLDNLSSLFTAHTVLTWLLASFQLVTAFLHFYLSFALSIPFSHLVDVYFDSHTIASRNRGDQSHFNNKGRNGGRSNQTLTEKEHSAHRKDPVVAEVDLRIKCQRVPYEGYEWVWWAWWAHRRAPIVHLFGILVCASGAVTLATALMLKRAIMNAADSDSPQVSLGTGAFVSLLTVILTFDTLLAALVYLFSLRSNLRTLLNPPDPSPTVLLLPPSDAKSMQHHRYTDASSFFAPRESTLDHYYTGPEKPNGRVVDTYLDPTGNGAGLVAGEGFGRSLSHERGDGYGYAHAQGVGTQDNPAMGLDTETIRWLAAYPSDPELVPLISDLRQGRINDDFLLSDVGLLYLRPMEGEDQSQALLVPPRGVIRTELIQDSHFDHHPAYQFENQGQGRNGAADSGTQAAHYPPRVMLEILSQTFWWKDMDFDVEDWFSRCPVCKSTSGAKARTTDERELAQPTATATATPWTGIMSSNTTSTNNPSATTSSTSKSTGSSSRPDVNSNSSLANRRASSMSREDDSDSLMAAEMAFVARKAQEDAER